VAKTKTFGREVMGYAEQEDAMPSLVRRMKALESQLAEQDKFIILTGKKLQTLMVHLKQSCYCEMDDHIQRICSHCKILKELK